LADDGGGLPLVGEETDVLMLTATAAHDIDLVNRWTGVTFDHIAEAFPARHRAEYMLFSIRGRDVATSLS
jgi:hypothetical protein